MAVDARGGLALVAEEDGQVGCGAADEEGEKDRGDGDVR